MRPHLPLIDQLISLHCQCLSTYVTTLYARLSLHTSKAPSLSFNFLPAQPESFRSLPTSACLHLFSDGVCVAPVAAATARCQHKIDPPDPIHLIRLGLDSERGRREVY